MKHYFVTPQDVKFPEDRFCAQCGEYFTHPNHPHARECPCFACQQERNLTKRAVDEGDSAPLQAESTTEHLPIEEADTTPALRN